MPTADQIIAKMLDQAANTVSGLSLEAIGEDGYEVANQLWKIAAYLNRRRGQATVFVCPHCRAVSYNPNDVAESYCGRCHWWTGNPVLAEWLRVYESG